MHQSNPTAPSPVPRATAGNLPALSVLGVWHGQILRAPGTGICLPRGHPRAFDTHVVSYPNVTRHGGFYWKHKQIGLSIKDAKNLQRISEACFVNFMNAFLHYLSRQKLHCEIGSYRCT